MNWDFRNLNLENYDLQRGGALAAGPHVVKVTKATMTDTKDGQSGQLQIEMEAVDGSGTCRDYITLFTKKADDKAKLAVEIGRSRLKTLLHFAGYPSDKPGDVKELDGLVVGVHIEEGEEYEKDGEKKKGFNRPRRRGQAYFDPTDIGGQKADMSKKGKTLNDDIPF